MGRLTDYARGAGLDMLFLPPGIPSGDRILAISATAPADAAGYAAWRTALLGQDYIAKEQAIVASLAGANPETIYWGPRNEQAAWNEKADLLPAFTAASGIGQDYEPDAADLIALERCWDLLDAAFGRVFGRATVDDVRAVSPLDDFRIAGGLLGSGYDSPEALRAAMGGKSPYFNEQGYQLAVPLPIPKPPAPSGDVAEADKKLALEEAVAYAGNRNTAPQATYPNEVVLTDLALPIGYHAGPPHAPANYHLSGRWRDASGSGAYTFTREDDASGTINSGLGRRSDGTEELMARAVGGRLWVTGATPASVTLVLVDLRPGAGAPRTYQSQGDQGFALSVAL